MQFFLQKTAISLRPGKLVLCGNDTAKSVPNNCYGWGRIDIAAAIAACKTYCDGDKND